MPRRLEAAYRATDYVVEAPGGALTLRIDAPSPQLAALQRAHGVRQSACLTAWNPGSVPTSAAVNARAQRRLLAILRASGYGLIAGQGRDRAGAWPAERSVLVLGISRARARALAAAFGQNALLHAGADAVPRLVWVGSRALSRRPRAPGSSAGNDRRAARGTARRGSSPRT